MVKAIYPISGKPIHNGHLHVYNQAKKLFGEVTLVIADNPDKANIPHSLIEWICAPLNLKVEFCASNELMVEYCEKNGVDVIVRGVRNGSDLDYEMTMDFWNTSFNESISTVIIPTPPQYAHITSSLIRHLTSVAKSKPLTYGEKYDWLASKLDGFVDKDVLGRWLHYNTTKPLSPHCGMDTIYFGKSCVGKSTYLAKLNERCSTLDTDRLTEEEGGFPRAHREEFISLMHAGDLENFNILLEKMADELTPQFWKNLFDTVGGVDMASLGFWFKYIPVHIRTQYTLIELTTTDERRERLIELKGFEDKIEFIDNLYVQPPYHDYSFELTDIK